MHSFIWILAALLAAAVALGAYLLVRLKKKDAEILALRGSNAPEPDSGDELTTAAIDQYLYDRCCKYMVERRPFLVDKYTLQDLANSLFTNRAYLSRTINKYSGRNFRSYVNYYRIMYSLELFRASPGLKVAELAELSGFKSNTSFYEAFREVMGEPPSHWCSRVRRNMADGNKNL